MQTRSVRRAADTISLAPGQAVTTRMQLVNSGWSRASLRAQLDAHRWQRRGRAVVLHNGPLHPEEMAAVALVNCGPRAALTAFTVAEMRGMQGWTRQSIHLLVPGGARVCRPAGVPMRIHWTGDWDGEDVFAGRHALAPALALAASTFGDVRPACGLLAAGVQQRLVTASQLRQAVASRSRLRHRGALRLAIEDIDQGAHALSEIDLGQLCRRFGLPAPTRQAIRVEPSGRRRYLDAEWLTAGGRRVVVEVDGALHLIPRRWWDDQLRQNELVISGDLVLRFPSVVVRHEQRIVADQLGRILSLW